MMKIGMVTPWKVRCGIFTYTKKLVDALVELGHEVYVIRLPRFGVKTPGILQNVVDSILVDEIDLIHIQHEYGLYVNLDGMFYPAIKRLGKPVVTTCHSAGMWEVDRVISEHSDRVIVHNEFCFRRFGHPENAGIIPHGCEVRMDPPPPRDECKKSLGLQAEAPIVGYLGFISPYKGLEILIKAMGKVKKAGLLIGGGWHTEGDTKYIYGLKELTLESLPSRCRWLGFVSDSDLERVYGAMDVFVYPSRFATESGALLTALSYGKAALASNISPFREKKKVGALDIFKSEKSLTRKIKRLLRDKEARRELEDGAINYCKSVSWKKIAERHLRLYEEMLQSP
jgi:glycosyltransferase involved in cell wall biosynthesis